MKSFIYLIIGVLLFHAANAQDSIMQRIIIIGDAGEIDKEQQALIPAASNMILQNKTTVIYLGDNIYPRGMGLPGSSEQEKTKAILQSQYKPMRSKGAPVYFIPGNHDWDKEGKNGLAKIKQQWAYLEEQQDLLLKLLPPDGCPGPTEINISKDLVIIVFDSEWWLFPFDKTNLLAECNCRTKKDVILRMQELVYKNRDKIIFLASHHPFQSYGTHGGYFSLKDNIFPLTAASENLYLPLPVIGSLYPLLRKTFTNPEDLNHPLYKNMIRQVDAVFDSFPNLVHIAGHEHGLQFIKDKQLQVVSGSGSKQTYTKKGPNSLFAEANQGFVVADLLINRTVRFTYFEYKENRIVPVFVYDRPYTQPTFAADSIYTARYGDSVIRSVHPRYNYVGKFHRTLFGENYRKEWAAPETLPLIRVSDFHGGLTPLQRGGGMQSNSLRLIDSSGNEWVIRSVEKSVDLLLPEALRATFAKDFLDDVTSGQHPYSALVVPPIADAVNVPHANPEIGVIAPDRALGFYERYFVNTICLIEEREPGGKSDNTGKMLSNLDKDNDNSVKGKEFLRARMLDMYLGDWDRHEDQWRWHNTDTGKDKRYEPVPRDRDQVLHVTQGWLPRLASKPYLLPTLQNFGGKIEQPKYSLFKARFLNAYTGMQFDYDDWMKIANRFTNEITDTVLETALKRLPAKSYKIRHDVLLKDLKERREDIPRAMDEYYRFINKIADIKLSDKNEMISIRGEQDGSLRIVVRKIKKSGEVKGELMDKTFKAGLTKEIRIYTGEGDDSISIDNKTSAIKLRIIGGEGKKAYHVYAAKNRIRLYDKPGSVFYGDSSRFIKNVSADSANTTFVPVNLYNITMPLLTIGINPDDGLLIGAGYIHTEQEGFRKTPYASQYQLMLTHSFSTSAFSASYKGEWNEVVGNADLTLQADAYAPDNTQNFFGTGNETVINKTGDYHKYYRARFNLFQVMPALRWTFNGRRASLSIGPAIEDYHFEENQNNGRYVVQPGAVKTYDSSSLQSDRVHGGLILSFNQDLRNNKLLPSWGSSVSVQVAAWQGLNSASKSFGQLKANVALFKSINARSTLVLAERVGGTVTIGNPAFYQTAFLGGQGNLLGYSKFRFAGENSLYNNLELRLKLADFVNYILPGQLGIFTFFDIGRVWAKGDYSGQWHNGTGVGLYFSPAQMAVIQVVAGHSAEGWYPYLSLGFRF
jgi:Calcineurin-like phosphoesterase/Omp85 superfamily domain